MDSINLPFDHFGRLSDFGKTGLDSTSLFGGEMPVVKEMKTQLLMDKAIDMLHKEMIYDEEGNIKKDTRGIDYLFADSFWNDRMEKDFSLIEQEFVKHCGERLQEFNDVIWYEDSVLEREKPSKRLQKRLLRLIYNGAKLDDEYCRKLIIYLYKLYFKNEYKQLRGISKIDCNMIIKSTEQYIGVEDGSWMYSICRILAMCDFMNITVNEDCLSLYTLVFKHKKNKTQKESGTVEVLPEHIAQISEWKKKEREDKVPRKNKIYKNTENFERACARCFGYSENFVKDCILDEKKLEEDMARVLAIMKNSYPDRKTTFEEVQRNTVIYQTVKALVQASQAVEIEFGYITGKYIEKEKVESSVFKPEKIYEMQLPKDEENEEENSLLTTQEDVSGYIEEIATLRSKVREKESEIAHLRELYKESKTSLERAEKDVEKYLSERDELIALREYAYRSELELEPIEQSTLEDMKKAIAQKKIVIIGGHVNWIGRLKNMFPDWFYITPDAYKMVERKMLEGKDKVYFFTDYLNHVTYGKFIAAVREKRIPFDYLGNTNMEQLIKQIYEDVITEG